MHSKSFEVMGGIHSIVNNKPTLSVSLHIYKTNQLNLSGVRIFDLENKKWAVLNDKAPSCTWNLPEEVPEKTYKRFPVFNTENCVAILMLWGVNNKTAVHDHKNYEGKIKVLKGELTEVYYKETKDFIEYEGAGVAIEGISFAEEMGGIHSIVNNKPTLSVSLHIYKTNN